MPRKKYKKLPRSFYNRPTLDVAEDILGKYIVYHSPLGKLSARIVEVEAYIGQEDSACHAARGKTKRNAVMFGKPGVVYIYFVYGMYHCLNFVTEEEGKPAAVLLRAAEPSEGMEIMRQLSPGKKDMELLSGPGKFCRSFGLTREQNGLDLTGSVIYLEERSFKVKNIKRTSRIGINTAKKNPWRFYDSDSKVVSK
ncbi:MAG: DNA-3-methyladenine glycosylase [FCB group bacterium]|nr:DNA-3-methyladenine glycosylase [FCB group bacterium]